MKPSVFEARRQYMAGGKKYPVKTTLKKLD